MLRSLGANFAMSTDKELPTFRKIEIPSSSSISHPGRVFLPLLGCFNLKMNAKLSFIAFRSFAKSQIVIPKVYNLQQHRSNNIYLFWRYTPPPPVSQGLLIHEVSRSHATTHHTQWFSSGRVISSSQKLLPDNIQHSQDANIHAQGGIRTYNLRRPSVADLRLDRTDAGTGSNNTRYLYFCRFT